VTTFRSAFSRLRELLDALDPAPGLEPVELHLGDYRGATPAAPFDALGDIPEWCRYPPLEGTAAQRAAYLGWLERRFGVTPSPAGGTIAVEPTPGSKQAVAAAIMLAVEAARARPGAPASTGTPRVILPNPFYPTYLAATAAAGAQPVFYSVGGPTSADPAGPSAPEPAAADDVAAALERAGERAAAVVLCNPGNPRGEILSVATLREIWRLATAAGAALIVDECYTDLGTRATPSGFLTVAAADARAGGPFLVLHSLSKRSGAPGLRSGFVAGDASAVAQYADFNRSCGVSSPLPVCAAAAALWSDDSHVERRREALARVWDLADEILGDRAAYRRAEAGFFLWLPVADDEEAARSLWRDAALRVMPGRYLAVEDGGVNPGAGHLRIALVHEEKVMARVLERLRALPG
jgi:aspartate/methionine/tyrosine aminotransferase